MKKLLYVFLAITMAFAMVACGGGGGGGGGSSPTPTVSSVTVTTGNVTLRKGDTQVYAASVAGTYSPAQTVTWSVEGASSTDTGFSGNTLTIGDDEATTDVPTTAALVVKATSTVDTTKSGTASVTVSDVPAGQPFVSQVVVSPASPTVTRGSAQVFTAAVTAFDEADEDVVWTVVGGGTSPVAVDSETTIIENSNDNHSATLNVADAEPNTTLLVKATSVQTSTTVGQAVVTLTGGPALITITFNYNYQGSPATVYATRSIFEGAAIGEDNWPAAPERTGYVSTGWFTAATGGTKREPTFSFPGSTTLYAQWIEDVMTEDLDAEVIFLENGAYPLFQFDIPADKTLADYESLQYQVKVSAGTRAQLIAGGDPGMRHSRLMGVYTPRDIAAATDDNGLVYLSLAAPKNYNGPYIMRNNVFTSSTIGSLVTAADTYGTATLELLATNVSGTSHAQFENVNGADATKKGTVYFGVGLAGNYNVSGAGSMDPADRYVQVIKGVKLVGKAGTADLPGTKPAPSKSVFPNPSTQGPQFVSYATPIVYSFRAQATQSNLDNWKTLVPTEPVVIPYDRGNPPALSALTKVDLGAPVYTYINKGNPNNQSGWASFEEAGQANDQDATAASTVTFANFNDAWYLELETASLPTGDFKLNWMGDAGRWVEGGTVVDSSGEIEGYSEIEGNSTDGYVIRIYLPAALKDYGTYYLGNIQWAAISLSYWGADSANLASLSITKASLLVENPAGPAEGTGLGITFELGTAPASGKLIDDVVLDAAGNVTISAVGGLTGFVWYVDGVKDAATGDSLVFTVPTTGQTKKDISLLAKKGGSWVSQSVSITLGK